MEKPKEIGKRVQKFRDSLGYTQPTLCKILQIGVSELSKIENGSRKIRYNELIELYKLGFKLIPENTHGKKVSKATQQFEMLTDPAQDEILEIINIKQKYM